jgi:dTDP-4-dehydrorhamnose 3,5-epimerase
MKVNQTSIEGLLLIENKIFADQRGFFLEAYNKQTYKNNGLFMDFVQDNVSKSSKNVLRGLHFQNPPFAQGKLVWVLQGAVLDVAVDVRKNSATYGKHIAVELTESNGMALWIPEGFAHGFLSLADDTIFSYKCTNYYNNAAEGSILYNDPVLNINWGCANPIISEKDMKASEFSTFQSMF